MADITQAIPSGKIEPDLRRLKQARAVSYHTYRPPLSPPPTSPLPRPPDSPVTRTLSAIDGVERPPKPQISLPDLRHRDAVPTETRKRTHRSCIVSNESGSDSYLLSPFPSPVKDKNRFHQSDDEIHRKGTDKTSSKTHTERLSTRRPPWYFGAESEPACDRQHGAIAWPLPVHEPLPLRRVKKNRRPPRRAIARSALHIPLPESCADSGVQARTDRRSQTLTAAILQRDDTITSLPTYQPPTEDIRSPDHLLSPHKHTERLQKPHTSGAAMLCPVTSEINGTGTGTAAQSVLETCESQPWYIRYKRNIWIAATVLFVLLASSGIAGGIIRKLS